MYNIVEKKKYLDKLSQWPRQVTEGTLIVTPNSGHFIHKDEPELAVMAIRRVFFSNPLKSLNQIIHNGSADDMIAQYKKMKNYYPENYLNPNILITTGYNLLQEKRQEESISVLQFYISENPDDFNGYDSLGEAYMEAGKMDQAILNYQKSLDLNPANTNAEKMLKKIQTKE